MEAGLKKLVELNIKQNINSNSESSPIAIDQNLIFTYDMNVEDVQPDGTSRIRYTLNNLKLTQSIPGLGETTINTADPSENKGAAADILMPIFSQMIGKSIFLKVNKKGKVLETDTKEIEMLKNKNVGIDDNSFENFLTEFPDNPVKIGDSWEVTRNSSNANASMKIKTIYSLKELKDGKAAIAVDADLSSLNENILIAGTMKGSFVVELKTGLSESGFLHQELDMTMNTVGKKIPMKISSDISMNLR